MNDIHPARHKYPPRRPEDPTQLAAYEAGQLKLFRLAYDLAPIAQVVTDPRGLVTEANPAALRLFARTHAEIEDRSIFDFLEDEYGLPLTETVGRMIREHRPVEDRQVFAKRRDARVPVALTAVPLIEDGEMVRVFGYLRDRTEEERLARIDAKTGLLNEVMFKERLDEYVLLARRKGMTLGLAYLDLRKFKPVNDRFGHAEGDRVIKKVGALLRTHTFETDIRSRLHGDEFAVLLVRLERERVEQVAVKLAEALAFSIDLVDPRTGSMENVTICADVGVIWREGAAIPDGPAFLELADHAMYACKRDQRSYILDVENP